METSEKMTLHMLQEEKVYMTDDSMQWEHSTYAKRVLPYPWYSTTEKYYITFSMVLFRCLKVEF